MQALSSTCPVFKYFQGLEFNRKKFKYFQGLSRMRGNLGHKVPQVSTTNALCSSRHFVPPTLKFVPAPLPPVDTYNIAPSLIYKSYTCHWLRYFLFDGQTDAVRFVPCEIWHGSVISVSSEQIPLIAGPQNFHSVELSLLWNIRSRHKMFPGTFAPYIRYLQNFYTFTAQWVFVIIFLRSSSRHII